jgi:DNA-binding beta-propeller fold protein YncE
VAVDAQTGAVVSARPLTGVPGHLVLAPATGRHDRRLYAVEASAEAWAEYREASSGRLLALDPVTLAIEGAWPLSPLPGALAVAPDGEHAYALTAHLLTHLDLSTGAQRLLAELPRDGAGLAVTEARVYAADPAGRDVWALERRAGRLVQTVPVGRHPVHLALGGTT